MDLNGSRLLLVGGSGLIGSHIVDQLIKEDVAEIVIFDNFVRGRQSNLRNALDDPRVRIIEGDIRNLEQVETAVEGMDGVFLLAALWLLECVNNPTLGRQVNIDGNFNVVNACVTAGVKRLVFSSSASVYGDVVIEPMPETHPLNNRTFYGATKIALEQILRSYYDMYDLNYVALRYFNVYGPRQDYRNAYVNVIMKVLDRIERNQPPVIFGDGAQSYDFVYVGDIARANIQAMKSEATDLAVNIATGIKTSINELVYLILELTGSKLRPEYQPSSQIFVTNRVGRPDIACETLNFKATTPLREGLKKLIAWREEQIQAEHEQCLSR